MSNRRVNHLVQSSGSKDDGVNKITKPNFVKIEREVETNDESPKSGSDDFYPYKPNNKNLSLLRNRK